MDTLEQAFSETEGVADGTLRSAASLTSQLKALKRAVKGGATG